MATEFKWDAPLPPDQVFALYEDANWAAYTEDLDLLMNAIDLSLAVLTAWEENRLVGLIRAVGDGLTILYIQDLLVLKSYQHQGIGSELVQRLLQRYAHVRQNVLLTEEDPSVRAFYEKQDFSSCDQGDLVAFVNLKA
ncbi:GNAT family N-acetyltransferase [Salsuginibacillus kocurii]|uniref:GNAT family N-acetyltransferase n=1 Tax=Salsuginibacillus kocurii TaxID=427078 RepID=UPI0003761CD4|nr:GNAT family N-acetyltransferase [Salsuginibacillus kocurii]